MKKYKMLLIVFIFIIVGVCISFAADIVNFSGDKIDEEAKAISGDITDDEDSNSAISIDEHSEAHQTESLSGDSETNSNADLSEEEVTTSGEGISEAVEELLDNEENNSLSSGDEPNEDEDDGSSNDQVTEQNNTNEQVNDTNEDETVNEEEKLSDEIANESNEHETTSGETLEESNEHETTSGETVEESNEDETELISGEQLEEKIEEKLEDYADYPKSYKDVYIRDVLVENANVKVLLEDKDGNYLDSAIYNPKNYYYLMALTVGMQMDAKIDYNEENNLLELDYIRFKNSLDCGTLISKNDSKNGDIVFMVNGKDYLMSANKLELQKNEFIILETIDGDTVSKHNGKPVIKKVPTDGVYVESKEEIERISDDAAIFEISEKGTRKISKEEVKEDSVYTRVDLTKGSIYFVSVLKAEGKWKSFRVEKSQYEKKFISIDNKEYEITDNVIKSIDGKMVKDRDITAYLNYLQMPIKIKM